jgi:hypothetical protein
VYFPALPLHYCDGVLHSVRAFFSHFDDFCPADEIERNENEMFKFTFRHPPKGIAGLHRFSNLRYRRKIPLGGAV